MNIEELKPLLADISEKLGQGGEFTWEAVMRQQHIDAYMLSVTSVILLFLITGSAFSVWWGEKKKGKYDGDGFMAAGLTFGLLFVVSFIFTVTGAVNHFMNPEWQAIQELMSQVK